MGRYAPPMSLEAEVLDALPRELSFLLYDVLGLDGREEHAPLLAAAVELADKEFLPLASELDANEPRFDGERVTLPAGLGPALETFVEGGFLAASFPEEAGGLGLPYAIHQAMMAAFQAVNPSAAAYPLLTAAAANLLRVHGSADQQRRYVEPMLAGRFFGTMALSEPHAGSSLADIRTRAIPQPDGSYQIVGDKMWISGGDHELAENIVHLVLAKLPDAPPGVKGISLFVVPRVRVDSEGKLGERNGVMLTGLNHKMGYRGTVNTALGFGGEQPALGELVGAPHQGLRCMFHMMNEARIGVGLVATMLGYAGYRASLRYARERTQGRHPEQRDPVSPPVPILAHADVRRMLLTQKVYAEGALGLMLYCATLVDELAAAEDDSERERVSDLLDILTPIAKAWPAEFGTKANDLAIQVLGGAGYTRDFPLERYYRDNRLNPIHEGANGIQGLDLLGRKVTQHGGRRFRRLVAAIEESLARVATVPELAELRDALRRAVALVSETTMGLGAAAMQGKIRLFLANASEYLTMLGHVVVGWMWLEQAAAAQRLLAAGAEGPHLQGKLHAARFFARYELTRIERQAALLRSLDDTTLTMPDDGF